MMAIPHSPLANTRTIAAGDEKSLPKRGIADTMDRIGSDRIVDRFTTKFDDGNR